MSGGDLFLIILTAGVLLSAAFLGGRNQGREEMIHRLLGMKRANNQWEVQEGTEIMGMTWVSRHWVYDDGRQVRRINCVGDEWQFDDGSKAKKIEPGLKELTGHWETADGKTIDPAQVKALQFADTLHAGQVRLVNFSRLEWKASRLGVKSSKGIP